MHWVENAEDLQRLVSEMDITHLFVGEAECRANMELIEKVAEKALVEVVAGQQFRLPRGSRIHIMRKPFYCFPVTSALNVFWNRGDEEEGRLFCPGVRALVVDDEPMNLTVAIGVFRGYGMVVETADSGMESIEKCRKTRYDIVFMDHMMPGMDGVEAMKRLRMEAGRQNQNFPIVALTANAVSSAKEMFLREGFDGFVSKPIEIMELERVLKHVLPKDVIRYEKNDGNASRMSMSETISPGARITRPDTDRQSAAESEPTDKPDRLPEPRTEPRDEPDAIDLSGLAEYDIDSRTGMRYCQEDVSFYRKLLLQFAKESEKKKSGMRESLSRQAYDEYAVYVHALKSTAKMIGAAELSERARQLEEAGKAGNGDFILASQDDLLELYEKTVNGIRSVCGEESAGASVASDSSDGVLEFAPSGSSGEDEVLEFAPSNASVTQDDEVLEFAPKGGGNA